MSSAPSSHARGVPSQSARRKEAHPLHNPLAGGTGSRGSRPASRLDGTRNGYRNTPAYDSQDTDVGSASTRGPSHKRTASGSFRKADVEELRRKEKSRTTTREAVISKTREPEMRPAQPANLPERSRPESGRFMPEQRSKPKEPEPEPTPWAPQASLIPHTTAPLAPRISIPPLASSAPLTLQPTPLHELSLEAQEAAMIEDLLFVFMGYEGQYIRFSPTYDPALEKDRLTGPTFRISPGLDPSLRDLTMSMLKMASHYCAIEAFVEVQSRDEFGAVSHALCAAIRKLLQDYLVLVAQLETQFLTNETFTLHILNVHTLPTNHMLAQIYALGLEILKKNALLDDDLDDLEGDMDDIDNILETLRDGGEFGASHIPGKKICKGGSVLRLITKRQETMAGDPAANTLLTALLRDASRPYMTMLNEWLHHGGIKDPHAEFLVKESKSIKKDRLEQDYTDEYWERRYTLREADVPPQLEAVKDKVMLAGKYLNVVRECGGVDVSKEVKDVPRSFDDPRFLENVNSAYAHANQSLMELLITTHALPARLRSLKHYFFVDRSDYLSFFFELGESELKKPVAMVNTSKLQPLLDIALRHPGSFASLDPFKEDVKLEMNYVTLQNSLTRVVNISGLEEGESLQINSGPTNEPDKKATGFTSLQLDYVVPFPVSLVISRKTVWRYQTLFRFLTSMRHVERLLTGCWQTHGKSVAWVHRTSSKVLENWKRRAWTLRARMLVFIQQLLYFCTAEVIEPNWQSLMSRLETDNSGQDGKTTTPRTVDELMQDHVDFLDTCLKECMLTNGRLLRVHSKLIQTCEMFSHYIGWLTREVDKTDPDLQGTEKPDGVSQRKWDRFNAERGPRNAAPPLNDAEREANLKTRLAKMEDHLFKYEHNFGRHLQILLDNLNHYAATETVVLLGLCARLSTTNQGSRWGGLRNGEEAAAV